MTLSFGTDGVRGPAPELLNPTFVTCLAIAARQVLSADKWIIGRDTRESGSVLSDAMLAALQLEGRQTATDVGVVPTPVIAHLTKVERCAGAVISASHNPWTDNGVKLFAPGGRKLHDQEQTNIEIRLQQLLADQSIASSRTQVAFPHPDPITSWSESIHRALDSRTLEGMHIVVDCANGAASDLAGPLFTELGAQVGTINASPNGRNINENCGSTNPTQLREAVLTSHADLGLAFDGDADRLVAIASDGTTIDGDRQLCLFAKDLAQRAQLRHGNVVITEMSNQGLREALHEAEISTIEVPVGDRNILTELDAGRATLGGEQSGHIIFWDHATTGDGMLSGALLADLIIRSERSSAELARDAMRQFPQALINVPVKEQTSELPAKVQEVIQGAEDRIANHGRVLVRPSGTEAVIRVMVEASEERLAQMEAQRLASLIQAAIG